ITVQDLRGMVTGTSM
nr:immunoglobulin heavy chain junction region [Mus musculus]